ncbi:hypothetical protein PILCRDRAFT_13493 [Piloderma croceum F 1598]|uniref:Uncharacterized protein n=1 Tax=Piloderma croceum (strain F 1598) TaxID=765440 RepID=A0A0C3F6K2_PILCF|nr:hypothetical protein PILCRDRAFT_13493 [Piloderma croceum F 1598]
MYRSPVLEFRAFRFEMEAAGANWSPPAPRCHPQRTPGDVSAQSSDRSTAPPHRLLVPRRFSAFVGTHPPPAHCITPPLRPLHSPFCPSLIEMTEIPRDFAVGTPNRFDGKIVVCFLAASSYAFRLGARKLESSFDRVGASGVLHVWSERHPSRPYLPIHAGVRIGAVEGGTGIEFGDRAEERDVGGRFPFCTRTNGNNEVRIPNALQFQSKLSPLASYVLR